MGERDVDSVLSGTNIAYAGTRQHIAAYPISVPDIAWRTLGRTIGGCYLTRTRSSMRGSALPGQCNPKSNARTPTFSEIFEQGMRLPVLNFGVYARSVAGIA
eukprot:2016064-Rhodomonas_salina.1